MKNSGKKRQSRKAAIGKFDFKTLRLKAALGIKRMRGASRTYLSRRPHRSFRLTRRRDYTRSLKLPGYWGFTAYVNGILWRERKVLIGVILVYTLMNGIFVGLSSQESYKEISNLLAEPFSGGATNGWNELSQAGALLLSGIGGSFVPELGEVQQIYAVVFLLLMWLTTVWLLRARMAGERPNLRDGLYNAGAPIVATGLVMILLMLQFVPIGVSVVVLNAVAASQLFASAGFVTMVAWIAVSLVFVLTLYWIVSTVFALIIVTLPGMYPWQAMRAAGDMVVGRRLRLLMRIIWISFLTIGLWIIVVLPVILIDRMLKQSVQALEWMPLVPVTISLVSSLAAVWAASYIYLLYRKVVEDDAAPA